MSFLFIGLMRFIAVLPLPLLRSLGRAIGWLLWHLARTRRQVALTNLTLCFSEKSQAEIEKIAYDHFVYFAQSLVDRAWLWHAPLSKVRSRLKWRGSQDAMNLLDTQLPKIVFAPHFVGLDAGGTAVTLRTDQTTAFIFMPQRNQILEDWVSQGRSRAGKVKPYFRHTGVKQIMTGLRQGETLHLSPDMDFGPQESIFVPFMGFSTATVPSLSRFARLGKAAVFMLVTRLTHEGYEIEALPIWENFPTEDLIHDTTRMNEALEAAIRLSPAQYYWVHKRFKTRPEGETSVYKKAEISR